MNSANNHTNRESISSRMSDRMTMDLNMYTHVQGAPLGASMPCVPNHIQNKSSQTILPSGENTVSRESLNDRMQRFQPIPSTHSYPLINNQIIDNKPQSTRQDPFSLQN